MIPSPTTVRHSEMPERVPILTYHSLDASGSVTSVKPGDFSRQMRLLARRGFSGLSLTELLDGWEGRAPLPRRPVVLTFDDGFANLLEHAAPVLAELKFHATLFAVSGRCGATNDWPHQAPGIPRLPLLSWNELAGLAKEGWEIGAHTVTHRPLGQLPTEDLQREIVESKTMIEDRLGQPVTTFAYPFGLINAASHTCVRENYRGACSVSFGRAASHEDRHALRRLDVYYFRHPALFALFGTLPGAAYLALRAAGRHLKARLSGGVS